MKKCFVFLVLGLFLISCNGTDDEQQTALMGFYEIGYDEMGLINCNTFITLVNSSEQEKLGGNNETIMVYTFFFDDNEEFLGCHREKLTPDDMATLNVQQILQMPLPVKSRSGVFKSIAVDSSNQVISTLVGFQTKKYFKEKELISVSESGLFATTSKVVPKSFMGLCKK